MNYKIAIIGLGYVGLPLAINFAKKYIVFGYDINQDRIKSLLNNEDQTKEADLTSLQQVIVANKNDIINSGLFLTNDVKDIEEANIYIVTVPTPVDNKKLPDLSKLLEASETISHLLKKNDIVIYESTVYPGCTEEECVPILEKGSNLKYNLDFYCGYSPERVSPGVNQLSFKEIVKVTSGSNPQVAKEIDNLYSSIVPAGTYLAPSISIAEASKSIENAQRDINISFMNEMALIFDKMNLDTHEVLKAASTKWNFLPFYPGLVGGHCISVDPYYLAYKAKLLGYQPSVILSGRSVNDKMGIFIADKVYNLLDNKFDNLKDLRVLILGITFKENCPDYRNTKVIDIYNRLKFLNLYVDIHDPVASKEEVFQDLNIDLVENIFKKEYSAIILAVSHNYYKNLDFNHFKKNGTIIYDVKNFIDSSFVDGRL